jgi:hypothetical protein
MEKIIKLFKKSGWWIKFIFWTKPTSKPPKDKLPRVKGEQVFKDYLVVTYHGQRVNLHRTLEYPIWKTYSRNEKRATAKAFEIKEKKGLIRFEEIDGKLICIKNKDYDKLTEKAKTAK